VAGICRHPRPGDGGHGRRGLLMSARLVVGSIVLVVVLVVAAWLALVVVPRLGSVQDPCSTPHVQGCL
jgi:hypothetical protein